MFSDRISIKAVLVGFFGYLILATVAMVIVIQCWIPSGITDKAELSRLAEVDPTLLLWQNMLGTVLSVLAGFASCRISGAIGLKNPLFLGILLVLYGVLGIYLHPDHPMLMQVAKLVAPVPLVLIGGWLCLRLFPSRGVDA
jgi:hypothetical protein